MVKKHIKNGLKIFVLFLVKLTPNVFSLISNILVSFNITCLSFLFKFFKTDF